MDWLNRLVVEHDELTVKIDKLENFLADPENKKVTGPKQWKLLNQQWLAMQEYGAVLYQRIEAAAP